LIAFLADGREFVMLTLWLTYLQLW